MSINPFTLLYLFLPLFVILMVGAGLIHAEPEFSREKRELDDVDLAEIQKKKMKELNSSYEFGHYLVGVAMSLFPKFLVIYSLSVIGWVGYLVI